MIDKECLTCDFYDPDYECTCSPLDRWYACPLEPEPKLEYTGEDIVIIIRHDECKNFFVQFSDGVAYDVPYSAISDEDFVFLHPEDDRSITIEDDNKMCDIFVKYVNTGKGVRRSEGLQPR